MRLIDAEALKHKRVIATYGDLEQGLEEREVVYVEDIDNAPTIEAKPVVHAHWDEVSGGRIICTSCGNYPLYDYFGRIKLSSRCPTCGAQMDEVVSDTNVGNKMDEPFPQAHENGNHIAEAGKKENKP